MQTTIDELLRRAVEATASDIHLKVGSPPAIRIDGELMRMQDLAALTPSDTEAYAQSIFTQKAAQTFKERGEADFAYGRPDIGRFRVSVYRQRGSVSLVLRRVVAGVPPLERLGLPPVVAKLAGESKGLLLVTGPSGSGRSTTIASIIEHINASRPVSIITIEDPIEALFPDKVAVVTQREVGVDVASASEGVRRATRQDADVIMVSEIADRETAEAAISAAETGHLLIAAMPTSDPGDTIERLIGFFPPEAQETARNQVATLLRGVISQRLLETADGTGRVLATEVLTGTHRTQERIMEGASRNEIVELIKDSEYFGMQTFDGSLLALVKQRRISVAAALNHVRNAHEFRARAIEAGIDA